MAAESNKLIISVIVPIYNAEKFLSKCLNSIVNQSYKHLEIILVNDGSTDSSLLICKDFELKDQRVKVINKINGGVASARAEGLLISTGDYIIHADADDYLIVDAYENLVREALLTSADIIIGGYYLVNKKGLIKILPKKAIKSNDLINSLLMREIHGALWNKLIKKELYTKVNFVLDLDFMEDLLLLVKILNSSESLHIRYINDPVYHYVLRYDSYTNKLSHKYLEIGDQVIRMIEQTLKLRPEFCNSINQFKLFHKLLYILNVDTCKYSISKKFTESNSYIWKSSLPFKYKFLLYCELNNIKVFSYIYKKLKKI